MPGRPGGFDDSGSTAEFSVVRPDGQSRPAAGYQPHRNEDEYLSGRVLPPAQGSWDERGIYRPGSGGRVPDSPPGRSLPPAGNQPAGGEYGTGDFRTGDFDSPDFSPGDVGTGDFETGGSRPGDFETGDVGPGGFDPPGFRPGGSRPGGFDPPGFRPGEIAPRDRSEASYALGERQDRSGDSSRISRRGRLPEFPQPRDGRPQRGDTVPGPYESRRHPGPRPLPDAMPSRAQGDRRVLPSGVFGSPSPPPAWSGGSPGSASAGRAGEGYRRTALDDDGERLPLSDHGRVASTSGTEDARSVTRQRGPENLGNFAPRPAPEAYSAQPTLRQDDTGGFGLRPLPTGQGYGPPGGRHPAGYRQDAADAPEVRHPGPAPRYTYPDAPRIDGDRPTRQNAGNSWLPPADARASTSRADEPPLAPAALNSPRALYGPDDDTLTKPLPAILPGAIELPRPAVIEKPRGFFEPARSSSSPVSPTGSVEPPPVEYRQPEPPRQMPEEAAANLDKIKDLYLTAEAIGEDALDKHFDLVSQRQRELIQEFFKNATPSERQSHQ